MAYNFIPTTPKEVSDTIPGEIGQAVAAILIELQNDYPMFKDPIAVDPKSPKTVKITRKIQTKLDIKALQQKFKQVKLSFGEGSRGGRGVGNKGNLFETELATDIENWWKGEPISSQVNALLIDDLAEKYDLHKWTELYVDAEGAENKPRPLQINGKNVLVSPGLVDIGAVVTDITLRKGKDKQSEPGAFLSLKFSGTVTFFNAGTKKYLTDAELQKGLITIPGGLALLDMFGIDNAVFCSVFNGKAGKLYSEDTTRKVNKFALENLIKSGIGYGFHMVHKMGSKVVSKEIDKAYRDAAAKVQQVTVYYGGKSGTGARVDIEVLTPKYILKFNFRNKQGGKYISHLMCDYSYR
jgi:hypothetical protein